jgi:hypothetical protein
MPLFVHEQEDLRAAGFSPDGDTFVLASAPSLVIFRRNITATSE